jgi:benzoyl-CoA reductase/2-hydroxyglutaryl-CoA dehydratase subunit BcrC/BadD/HgdB
MDPITSLQAHLRMRAAEISRARAGGAKVVGYLPGGFFPVELALAAGVVPLGLIRGGDHMPVELAGGYVCRWVDAFARAQMGYAASGQDPYYKSIDLLVAPITDNHRRALSDVIAANTPLEVFTYGVPHMKEPATLKYYRHGLDRCRKRLEKLTGTAITADRLDAAIRKVNQVRVRLREISLSRRSPSPGVRSRDFILLNHGVHLGDLDFMLSTLEAFSRDGAQAARTASGPRVLLTGPTLAYGDNRVLEMIEEAGGVVVAEEFAEGIFPYWEDVETGGEPMEALARAYFMRRVPPGWFRPGRERLDFLVRLVRDYKADAIVWYQLMYRESYKTESYYFPEQIKAATGVSTLVIESDYDPVESEQLRTRLETFLQMVGG